MKILNFLDFKAELDSNLTDDEKDILLELARETLDKSVRGKTLDPLNLAALPARLTSQRALFVGLLTCGKLRGCIGSVEPYCSIAEDVRSYTIAAASQDSRFPKVAPKELANIVIEITLLTKPERLHYVNSEELVTKIRPQIDGVTIYDGDRSTTLLPQSWEQFPEQSLFLGQLCHKLGAPPNLWKQQPLELYTYQVDKFQEKYR